MRPAPTERLRFGQWSPDDVDLAWSLWGDPEVTRLFGGPFSREQVQTRLDKEIANAAKLGYQYWPIFLIDTGEFVGCCGLRPERDIQALGFEYTHHQLYPPTGLQHPGYRLRR